MMSIRTAAKTTGVVKPHGLKGKSTRAIKPDDPRMDLIRSHFAELETLAEVRATRFISTLVDGRDATTDT